MAETDKYKAEILNALVDGKPCTINGNNIYGVKAAKNQKVKIDLHLNYYDYCSMEVKVYGY